MRIRTAALVPLTVLSACALRAQGRQGEEQSCHLLINRLNSAPHSAAFRQALQDGRLARCGEPAARALASVLRTSVRDLNEDQLRALAGRAAAIRSDALIASALEVAQDRTLPEMARITALQIAVAQHDIHFWFPEMLHGGRPEPTRPICYTYISEYAWQSGSAPAASYRERIINAVFVVANSTTESEYLRRTAGCTVQIVRDTEIPDQPLDDEDT